MYSLATSELLSTFFPTWIWQGRQWLKWRIPKYDKFYWLNTHSHPVLSTYYPVSIILSMLGNLVRLDTAFKLFVLGILSHYIWAFIGFYVVLQTHFSPMVSLFGAITFTFQGFHIRQQPCIVYTFAWFPWIGICPPIAIGMILLAGYYPLALYLLPLGLLLNHDPASWLLGLLIGSIQLVPFLRYLPKTIRANKSKHVDTPPWEKHWYFGLTPFLLVSHEHLILIPIALSLYLVRHKLPRVPFRSAIILTYVWIFLSVRSLDKLSLGYEAMVALILVQCLDLYLHNRHLPPRPYCELYNKPSRSFDTPLTQYLSRHLGDYKVSGLPYPLFTGLVNEFRTLGYNGGMQLKLMAKFRNEDGLGEHDWFKSKEDSLKLDTYGVKFAYTSKRIDWENTPIRNLYKNPRIN